MILGKRGCAIKLAFLLQLGALMALVLGCVTPYWSRVENETTGDVLVHEGLLVSYVPDGDWAFRDFNTFKKADSDETILYLTLSVSFGLMAMFLQFFLVQAYAFALYNASCGRRYSPDWLMIFSLLSGLTGVTTLVLYEQYTGRDLNASTDVKMDFSRGFVVISVASIFLASFFTVCDRTAANDKK